MIEKALREASDLAPRDTTLADASEEKARARRPRDWIAPGPRPRGDQGRRELLPASDEDHAYLTGDYRIFQLRDGHRWSLDDFATAWIALAEARRHARVTRFLDLGCGIGSVLMMIAWGLPQAEGIGVEAQARSASMARRSLAWNGADDRCRVESGDLRSVAEDPSFAGAFDLVTGTPPYIPVGRGTESEKAQRGPCCFETRGGIEAYAEAAARALAPGGLFVACVGTQGGPVDRGDRAARAQGLAIVRRVAFVPRETKPALFWVYAMKRARDASFAETARGAIVERFRVRDAAGEITPEMHAARRDMGFPPVTPRRAPSSLSPSPSTD